MTNPFGEGLDRWVAAGILDEDTAETIRAYEADRTSHPLSVAAEGLAYFGGMLAAAALFIGLTQVWSDWDPLAKVTIVTLAAIVLGLAGWRLSRETDAVLVRFTDVLLAGGIVLAGWVAALVVAESLGGSGAASGFVFGVLMAALGGALWRVRRRPLPLVLLAAGIAIGLVGLLDLVSAERWLAGVGLWGFGAGLIVGGRQRAVEPATTGIVLGVVAAGLGAQLIASDSAVVGALLGLTTMLTLLVVAMTSGSVLLLILGGLGTFVFAPQLVVAVMGESAAGPLALLGLGLALFIVAIATVRTVERWRPSSV